MSSWFVVARTAACPEVKEVLTPTSQESQDEVMSVWSVCHPTVQGPLVSPDYAVRQSTQGTSSLHQFKQRSEVKSNRRRQPRKAKGGGEPTRANLITWSRRSNPPPQMFFSNCFWVFVISRLTMVVAGSLSHLKMARLAKS